MADFDAVVVDHAHCEKKAAASAMALVAAYPDRPVLVRRLIKLAREELRHMAQVHAVIVKRGLKLGRDPGDPYVQALLALVRSGAMERLVDRLLVSCLIEARSCERLALLAGVLPTADLRRLYHSLATAESGHGSLFVELAEDCEDCTAVHHRLDELAEREAEIVRRLPLEPRIH